MFTDDLLSPSGARCEAGCYCGVSRVIKHGIGVNTQLAVDMSEELIILPVIKVNSREKWKSRIL